MSRGFGGLELYVLKVAKYLNSNNYSCNVVACEKSFMFNKLTEGNIPTTTLASVFHHLPLLSSFKLAKYIDANKVDVLHVHWGKDLFFVVLAKVFCKRKVKLIYTRQMLLTRNKDDFYHRFLYKNVDVYITITKALNKDAVKYLPLKKEQIRTLYYGVPSTKLDKNTCEKLFSDSKMRSEMFKIAIFGRIEKAKGQHVVIESIKNIKKMGKNIQLAMIGHIMDPEYFQELETEIKNNNLQENIYYLGFHDNPTSVMPCFDAVVLATKCETFGLVLPEAMRAGTAVIGTNCGGVPEIIEHEKTGLLFEPESVQDLTKQLLKIVNDNDFCMELASAGKKDADERFSEEKHFSSLIEIFESV